MEIFHKLLLFLLLAFACAVSNQWHSRTLALGGGRYFFNPVLIELPHFSQGDPRWGDQPLGSTVQTLAQEGCAVASAAMVLAGYGASTDPGKLNTQLTANGGYTERGWLYWEKALELALGPEEVARGWSWYEDKASYALIDLNLRRGNPVIVRLVRLQPDQATHFVVIVGKQGWRYRCLDPGRAGTSDGRWLDNIAAKITGLRFYQRMVQ